MLTSGFWAGQNGIRSTIDLRGRQIRRYPPNETEFIQFGLFQEEKLASGMSKILNETLNFVLI